MQTIGLSEAQIKEAFLQKESLIKELQTLRQLLKDYTLIKDNLDDAVDWLDDVQSVIYEIDFWVDTAFPEIVERLALKKSVEVMKDFCESLLNYFVDLLKINFNDSVIVKSESVNAIHGTPIVDTSSVKDVIGYADVDLTPETKDKIGRGFTSSFMHTVYDFSTYGLSDVNKIIAEGSFDKLEHGNFGSFMWTPEIDTKKIPNSDIYGRHDSNADITISNKNTDKPNNDIDIIIP